MKFRNGLVNKQGWDSKRIENLALDIQRWLAAHDMWQDVYIYYDGKCMGTSGTVNGEEVFRYNGEPFIGLGADPRRYFEYVANPHILSMSFEGPLYEVLNGYCAGWVKLESEFRAIFEKHGVYFELGHSWNLTCYEG